MTGRISAALVERVGPVRLLTAGVVVALVAAVAMVVGVLVSSSVWALLVPLLVQVSCTGVLLPNSTALALESQGRAAGSASAPVAVSSGSEARSARKAATASGSVFSAWANSISARSSSPRRSTTPPRSPA